MRKCLGVLMVVTLLLASSANATQTWNVASGDWSVASNWSGLLTPGISETAQVNVGTCNLDSSQTIGQFLMGAAAGNVGVLNVTSGANLTIGKASSEILGMLKAVDATSTVNHSAGTIRVFGTGSSAGKGETRLVTSTTLLSGSSTYNLSGTAVLDTEVLSKGNASATGAVFNATGGTLVLRNMIYRFGLISNGFGFNQGQATLEVGAINSTAAINVGNATNAMDYTAGTGAILNIDIAGASDYDKVTQYGTVANLAGATMNIDLLGGYTPDAGSFFDVWAFSDLTKSGSGSVIGLPTGWSAAWVDTGTDGGLDTLRLTYTPEPATIALLGLGFLAMRRSKK
jgi:hypothetical protein